MLKFLYLRHIVLFELVDLIFFFIKSRFCFIPSTACDSVCSGCMGAGPDQCKACGSGYQFSEGTCTGMMLRLLTKHSFPGKVFKKSFMLVFFPPDINECSQPEPVCTQEHQECVNSKGSYMCVCSVGYKEDEDGKCVQVSQPGWYTSLFAC